MIIKDIMIIFVFLHPKNWEKNQKKNILWLHYQCLCDQKTKNMNEWKLQTQYDTIICIQKISTFVIDPKGSLFYCLQTQNNHIFIVTKKKENEIENEIFSNTKKCGKVFILYQCKRILYFIISVLW